MQRVTISFSDGEERELCHDGTGGVFENGFEVGLADDENDLGKGGTGQLYSWGPFTVLRVIDCRGACADCPAW